MKKWKQDHQLLFFRCEWNGPKTVAERERDRNKHSVARRAFEEIRISAGGPLPPASPYNSSSIYYYTFIDVMYVYIYIYVVAYWGLPSLFFSSFVRRFGSDTFSEKEKEVGEWLIIKKENIIYQKRLRAAGPWGRRGMVEFETVLFLLLFLYWINH